MDPMTFDITVDFDSPPTTREQVEAATASYYSQFGIEARVGKFGREPERRERHELRLVRRERRTRRDTKYFDAL